MNNFFSNISYKARNFMQGRYGTDEFAQFLLVVEIILIILTMGTGLRLLNILFWAVFIYAVFRMLSKNNFARMKENVKYLEIYHKVRGDAKTAQAKAKNHKTTLYFKCSGCGTTLSVPKGKGRIRVVCPKCHKEVFKNS